MNHKTPAASTPASLPLCSNVTARGRRCRLPVTHPGSPFCRSHSRIRQRRLPEANPLADFPPELSSFNSYADVSRFLARLLTLLSENRISPRRAAVLSYIANSLLNSLRAAERQAQYEAKNEPEELRIDWTGIPRPEREFQRFADAQDSHPNDPPPVAQPILSAPDPSAARPVAQTILPATDPSPVPSATHTPPHTTAPASASQGVNAAPGALRALSP